jgi:hypothetical protein
VFAPDHVPFSTVVVPESDDILKSDMSILPDTCVIFQYKDVPIGTFVVLTVAESVRPSVMVVDDVNTW